jgi:hypothetical protein
MSQLSKIREKELKILEKYYGMVEDGEARFHAIGTQTIDVSHDGSPSIVSLNYTAMHSVGPGVKKVQMVCFVTEIK